MGKSRKLIIYFSIFVIVMVMISLFYYSMRETLRDYFFDNGQVQREKATAASGDQAQIMVDLANKRLVKQKEDNEVRDGEEKNQSLYKESNSNEATIKKPAANSQLSEDEVKSNNSQTIENDSKQSVKKSNPVQNGFVVVDCEKGGVIACPHHDVQTGTSPLFYPKESSHFLVGRCLDLSIDVKTFCP